MAYRYLRSIVLVCFVLFISFSLNAQTLWQQTNGPYGGQVNALVINPINGNIFAGTYASGIFRSTNNGGTWTKINNGLMNDAVWSLATNSSGHLIAGTYGGIYISTNNGDNWSLTALDNRTGWSLVVDQSGRIFAGTDKGIFLSTNSGAMWTQVAVMNFNVNALMVDQNNHVFAGTSDSGVYRSTDNGNSWVQVNTGITYTFIQTLYFNSVNGGLFAGSGALYHSTDNGDHWSQLGSFGNIRTIAMNQTSGQIFCGTENGMYRSTDNGGTWNPINNGLTIKYVSSILLNTLGQLFAATGGGGVYRSSDNGDTWTQRNTGLFSVIVKSLAYDANSDNTFAGTSVSAFYRTSNSGIDWSHRTNGISEDIYGLAINPVNGHLFAATLQGMFRSMDYGDTWQDISAGITTNTLYTVAIKSDGTIFIGSYLEGIFRSVDNGAHWTKVNTGLTDTTVYAITFDRPNYVYAGTEQGGVFRSTNNGDTWTQYTIGMTDLHVRSLAVQQGNGHVFAGTNGGCFKSTDHGATWIATSLNSSITSMIAHLQNTIFASTSSGAVNRTTDDGTTWENFSDGLPGKLINALSLDSAYYLYAGTYGEGVYRTAFRVPVEMQSFEASMINNSVQLHWSTATETNNFGFEIERMANGKQQMADGKWQKIGFVNGNGTSIMKHAYSFIDNNVEIGSTYQYRLKQVDIDGSVSYSQIVAIKFGDQKYNFRLEQNYPNPISLSENKNASTTISFSIPSDQHVTLKVYDVLGREVMTLLDEERSSGQHIVQFNCSRLSGGIYFYKLTTGNFSAIKQMTVVR